MQPWPIPQVTWARFEPTGWVSNGRQTVLPSGIPCLPHALGHPAELGCSASRLGPRGCILAGNSTLPSSGHSCLRHSTLNGDRFRDSRQLAHEGPCGKSESQKGRKEGKKERGKAGTTVCRPCRPSSSTRWLFLAVPVTHLMDHYPRASPLPRRAPGAGDGM
jgi:hypothetical protein